MLVFGSFKLVTLLIECLCMASLTPNVMVMRGLIFHPLFCKELIRGSYLLCLCVRAWSGYLSRQFVNSMSWIVSVGEGDIGVCMWFRVPIMHRMYGRNLAWQWHITWEHVHLKSQSGIVCSCGLSLRFHALVSVKTQVFFCELVVLG